MITSHSSTGASLQYANLDGTDFISTDLTFGAGDFTFYSLISQQSVSVEPDNWDFVLTGVSVRTGAPCVALGAELCPVLTVMFTVCLLQL